MPLGPCHPLCETFGPLSRFYGVRATLRALSVVLSALLALASVARAEAHKPRPQCTIPRGWSVAASDAQTVIIKHPHPQYVVYTWRYCLRRTGVLRLLVDETDEGEGHGTTTAVGELRLSGLFVAYDLQLCAQSCRYRPPDETIYIHNLLTGRVVSSDLGSNLNGADSTRCPGPPGPLSALLLASNGIAAWQVDGCSPERDSIQALSSKSGTTTTLDSTPRGELANLQLYSCALGCAPNTAVVAWTHGGGQRYAQVS